MTALVRRRRTPRFMCRPATAVQTVPKAMRVMYSSGKMNGVCAAGKMWLK